LSELTNLAVLELYQNSLTQLVPESFSSLTDLSYLSLKLNSLSGELNSALCAQAQNANLTLNIDENPNIACFDSCWSNVPAVQFIHNSTLKACATTPSHAPTFEPSKSPSPAPTNSPGSAPKTDAAGQSNAGAIAGGVVGGVAGLAIIGYLVYHFYFSASAAASSSGNTGLGLSLMHDPIPSPLHQSRNIVL